MVLYCRPAVFSITCLHQVTVFEPSHVQTTAKMGLNTREDEDKDLSDNMTRWFWLRCQIGIKYGICLAFPVALIDVNTLVCLPGVCWYTGTGMSLWQVVETHRNAYVAGEADVDAEVNKSLFPGTFRKKGKKSQGSYFYRCADDNHNQCPVPCSCSAGCHFKKVTTPSNWNTGSGFCHTVLFIEKLSMFLAC